jgi:hypothetical protein
MSTTDCSGGYGEANYEGSVNTTNTTHNGLTSITAGKHLNDNCTDCYTSPIDNSAISPQTQFNIGETDHVASVGGDPLMENVGHVSGYTDPVFIDNALFEAEDTRISNAKSTRTNYSSECIKNPGHFSYFQIHRIQDRHVPSQCRYPEFIQFLQLMGVLTVRIVISVTSKDRSRDDPALNHSPGTAQRHQRAGTGFVTLSELENIQEKNDQPVGDSDNGVLRNLKRFVLRLVSSSSKATIYIETNRHLVYNDEEASTATAEFFYNDASQRGIKVVKGVRVLHSKAVGDHRSILECRTSDIDLVQLLSKTRGEVLSLAEKLPRRTKRAMCKKLFIIHHPHGCEKVFSYGDSVLVKYDLQRGDGGRVSMTRFKNTCRPPVTENIRKVLLYAADTCEGSTGAPIFTFKRGPPDNQGQASLVLDIWLHNGVDKTNKLGGSIMKVCTPDDFEVRQTPGKALQAADSDDEEDSGNQEVNSPLFKVETRPTYPVYVTYQKRLESYESPSWTLSNSQTPDKLAKAGFFYAGYSDCVRCFQCGLGLKSWKPEDEAVGEHRRCRPGCPYLQALGSQDEQCTRTETSKAEEGRTEPSSTEKNIILELLENENMKLKEQLTCKVCKINPSKDLFLPCGELCACAACSKLLTHCPSCQTQIRGTVVTNFA